MEKKQWILTSSVTVRTLRRENVSRCLNVVMHMTLPGHFPHPGPDLGGAQGIATGVAGEWRGVQCETIAGISN